MPVLPIARTPLWSWQARHGAVFREVAGWQLAAAYGPADSAAPEARCGAAICDLSACAKLSVLGPGAAQAARALAGSGGAAQARGVSSWPAVPPGQRADQLLACRLHDEHLLLLAGGVSREPLEACLRDLAEDNAARVDVTCGLAQFGLVGANTGAVLRQLTALDLRPPAFPEGTCAETRLAGVHALLVRPPLATQRCIYVLVAWDVAEYVWERLLEAGEGREIALLGWDAWLPG